MANPNSPSHSLPATPISSSVVPKRRDPWAFETTKPNPLTSYTRARDERGFSEWVKARVQPDLHDLVWRVIGQNIGWKNMGDAIRDSLIHRITQLMELATEDVQFDYQRFQERQDWLERMAYLEKIQAWVSDACESADRIAATYIQRDQPAVGARKLRTWLKDLPHEANIEADAEDPDSDFVASYVKAKIDELEDLVRGKFRNKQR